MKEKDNLVVKTLNIFTLIILYYIVGKKNIFLYTISVCLYNIFVAAFNHISLTNSFNKFNNIKNINNLFKYTLLTIITVSIMFLLLGLAVSDVVSILLNLNDILIVFVFMGLTIIIEPFIKLLGEYLIKINNNLKFEKIIYLYNIVDNVMLLVIALLVFRVFNIKMNIAVSLLYLSKLISAFLITLLMYFINNRKKNNYSIQENVNYKKEIKNILTKNSYQSMIVIVKNSYYYISIIIAYLILMTRYGYKIDIIERDLTFIYLFGINIINYILYIVKNMNNELPRELSLTNRIYNNFKIMLSLAIIFSIVSPLTCKVLFNNPEFSIYLVMLNFMAIFSLLYDITYKNIKNTKLIYTSLLFGLIVKIVTEVPLINAFYRMGYNLIYGDILASVLGLLLSILINYIFIKKKEKTKENYFTKLLDIFYENIILCIILIIIQFIIPIKTDNYFIALGLFVIYIGISIGIMKLRNKKRG